MAVVFFQYRFSQTIPCPFHGLGIVLQFPEAVLNAAQLFKHELDIGDNTIKFAHSTTSLYRRQWPGDECGGSLQNPPSHREQQPS